MNKRINWVIRPFHPNAQGYVAPYDGLRFVAIISVLLFHAGWFKYGFLGVQAFFVLSGFLISTLIVKNEFSVEGLIKFYLNRFIRLTPVLWLSVAFGGLVFWIKYRGIPFTLMIHAAFYARNFYATENLHNHDLWTPTWSLASEEQFYLMAPLLILFFIKKTKTRRFASVIFLVLYAYGSFYFTPNSNYTSHYVVNSSGLLLGVFMGVSAHQKFGRSVVVALFTIGLAYSLSSYKLNTTIELSTALYILQYNNRFLSPLTKILSFRPFCKVGIISYSIYIWHGMVLALVLNSRPDSIIYALAGIIISVLLGGISYVTFELPVRLMLGRKFKILTQNKI